MCLEKQKTKTIFKKSCARQIQPKVRKTLTRHHDQVL